ncbi:hypothetical protein TRFO_14451 [Tritrichomonas foetus]|uniref:Importin N-terminal domain-containing protein n=1 Tax=Tritrichomonas foetus TaxID=1144522 RepID=A0A1J4KV38_9EUKA|nr:hypothetical protein TRFO_14451 [Tritrichomonas foetus]|eukprot:OHT15099.1 hypothetical protein TRFO_14451 [Tritrichomonas foetus]
MEELLLHLGNATNQDPEIQARLAQFINIKIQSPDFGNSLFDILQNTQIEIPHQILQLCCNILKLWAKVQFPKMTFDMKLLFFKTLKKLILDNHPTINDLSIVYIDIAASEKGEFQFFESDIYDFFNKLSANPPLIQLNALTNIVLYFSKRYKRAAGFEGCEPTLLFKRVIHIFEPILNNIELLGIPEGHIILCKALSIFKNLFFRVHTNIHKASLFLNFAKNVLISYCERKLSNEYKLVSRSCSFLNAFYSKHCYKKVFIENVNEILHQHFIMISITLENSRNDTFLIFSILRVIETFRKFIPSNPETLSIILNTAKLSPIDIEEFSHSPNIFYYNVYAKNKHCESNSLCQISRSLIFSMIKSNPSLFQVLLSFPPDEHVIRCTGYCLDALPNPISLNIDIFKYCEPLFSTPNNSNPENNYNNIFEMKIVLCAHLDFLRHFLKFASNENKMNLMLTIVPKFLIGIRNLENEQNDTNFLLSLFACKIFKKLLKENIPPFDHAIEALVNLLPKCFSTSVVLESVQMLISIQKDTVLPYSEKVLIEVLDSLEFTISQYIESNDANQIENSSELISSNLRLSALLIESTGSFLVSPRLFPIIEAIFKYSITDCCEEFSYLLTSIFSTDSQLIPPLTQIWFSYAMNDSWNGFVDQLIEPFFQFVSKQPNLFLSLNITEQIEEVCLGYLIETNSEHIISEKLYKFSTLLVWTFLVDSKIDVIPALQCIQMICSIDYLNIQYYASFFDIMAAITIIKKMPPPDQHLLSRMIESTKQNWPIKLHQKRLYAIFYLTLSLLIPNESNFYFTLGITVLNEEKIQENVGNDTFFHLRTIPFDLSHMTFDEDYNQNYVSPIYTFDIDGLVSQVIQICHPEIVDHMKVQLKELFPTLQIE